MKLPFTQKMLVDWAGDRAFRDAELLVESGRVIEAVYDPPSIRGAILRNNRPFQTSLNLLPDGTVESRCPCRENTERGVICAHVIAVGLVLVRRSTDPRREEKYQAELRRASRIAAMDESQYIRRVTPDVTGAIQARLRLSLPEDWIERCRRGQVPVACEVEYNGRSLPLSRIPKDAPLSFNRQDENLLYVIEDIADGPAPDLLPTAPVDFVNLLRLCVGASLPLPGGVPIAVNATEMTTLLKMDLDRENGELILMAHTELPFMRSGDLPAYIVAGQSGWVFGAGNLWPLANVLPGPYHPIYQEPVVIRRRDVLRFFKQELPLLAKYARIESDIAEDLLTVEPGDLRLRILVKGSPASLAVTLFARYGDIELVAGKPEPAGDFAVPDPDDLMRYTIRNMDKEKQALAFLSQAGLTGEVGDALSPVVGERQVLNFLGSRVPLLRRGGWQVTLEGKIGPYMDSLDFATPVVKIGDAPQGWFDVGFDFEDSGGQSLSRAEVQRALMKGDSYVEKGGRRMLFDSDAVNQMFQIFADCSSAEASRPGEFRMAGIHAAFVKSSLDALDGADVEVSKEWRARAGQCNRSLEIQPAPLPEPLAGLLRPYQRDGVDWLRFLEMHGFCGILADEMGLGKTVQALAWLQLTRWREEVRGKPAMVVCPTSLVDNWAEEAARFVPDVKVLAMTGADRATKWERISGADIVVTSYALLRRDVDQYVGHEFSALVLDEAQHIKNRATQNAVAAKTIKAHHRLVLTGTPVENGVSDLWSIMDFLMPGYLGPREAFRSNYEIPIQHSGADGDAAQIRLKRKIHPFLLRRLKREVAKELPPKIEKVVSCSLTADQRTVYTELLQSSRSSIGKMVAGRGFNKCRMEVLAVLLRLRQVCCHLGLLKLPGIEPKYPSAKMDLFFELVDEAMDGGHRILVFSQFVSMLRILRKELEDRGLAYCYLDGATKDRMSIVHEFNTRREIPFFLISLKAGGTGLNLTGADMVVHFDPWWNPAVENQATDRAHRIGQKRTVYSIKLVTKGTVEEKVLALQQRKKAIIDATVESDEQLPQNLSWDDIQELLSL